MPFRKREEQLTTGFSITDPLLNFMNSERINVTELDRSGRMAGLPGWSGVLVS